MKKIVAVLLVLIMVLPMCLVAQAEDTNTEIRPYYLVNWALIPEEVKEDNVYPFFFLWSKEPKPTDTEMYVIAKDYGVGNDIDAIAQCMKEEFSKRPVGTRIILFGHAIGRENTVDLDVFLDRGEKLSKDYLEKLLSRYKEIGGELDGIAIDMEYHENGAYYLDAAVHNDPLLYKKIVEDPRYQEKIRPLLVERGFHFWENVNDYQPEIYSIAKVVDDTFSRDVWDSVMHEMMIRGMNDACSPLFKYFPDASLSNYRYYAAKSWVRTMENKGTYSVGGNVGYVGNTPNENAYFYRPSATYFKEANTSMPTFNYPLSYNKVLLDATKFNSFMWDMHIFKNMMQSSDTENMTVWIAKYDYSSDPFSGCNSPYYAESYFHIGLMNPLYYSGYIPNKGQENYALSLEVVADILHELTRVGGAADRKYINLPHEWNRSFALTGMYAGGRNIWRITPDTTYVSKEEFLVEGAKDPTFYINGQTVTFPGGKIIEDGNVREVGTCGYWVETATDVMPIVTSDANRFEKFPAFEENYNGYETGMEYTYNNVEYIASWQIKKNKDATALVQEDKNNAGNKVLAVTGTFSMKNVRVTENVTAGDTYAEDQAWEVTATIPADMGADAEAILLGIYGDKSKAIDGGFKVAGGKLYYYNADKYVEFEGVDVSAGGKFTFKRNMDFNTADAFTCDYTVYDAAGKVLGKVKDIPVAKDVKIPIQSVGMEFSKISGDPVLVDDYKLYATGITTDFELFGAKHGMEFDDLETPKNEDTAYRLSWMNATAYDKVYSIVAAYYNGDKLVEEKVVKEIKMAPGTDAIETGIVEVAEGQSVRVYVRNDSQPEPEDDITTPGNDDPGKTMGDNSVMLIAIIAGAVILVAVIVVVIVVASKKKKSTPVTEEKTEEAEDNTAE